MGNLETLDRTGENAPAQKPIAELWRSDEAAHFLRISTGHLRRLVMLRAVPVFKPFGKAGRSYYDPDDLAQFVRRSRVAPMAERCG